MPMMHRQRTDRLGWPPSPDFDGMIGLSGFKLARVHFDFDRMTLSYVRLKQ